MKHNIKMVAILAAAVLLSGCATRLADMTVGSTKNFDLNSASFTSGKRVVGQDLVPVVFVPLGIPNFEQAIDNAIEQDKCAVGLTDVVLSHINQSFVVGRIGYRVQGDLVIDQSKPGCGPKIGSL